MDDIRALLERAAAGPEPAPPTVAALAARRRTQLRSRGAAVVAAAGVAAVAVVVVATVRPSVHAPGASTGSPHSPAPSAATTPPTPIAAIEGYRWRALPPAPVAPRGDAAVVWTGAQLFVWGGTTGYRSFADGALYDPAKRSWTKLPAAPLSARSAPVATLVGRTVIVWGGSGRTDGARYDLDRHRWSTLPAVPRVAHGATAEALVTAGGRAVLLTLPAVQAGRTIHVAAYDPGTNRWSSRPSLVEGVHHDVAQVPALGVGSTVYAWPSWSHTVQTASDASGVTYESGYGTDAYRLDAGASRWRTTRVAPVEGNSGLGAQPADAQILFPQSQDFCGGCFGPAPTTLEPALVSLSGVARTIPNGPLGPAGDNIFWAGGGVLSYDSHSQIGGPGVSIRPGDLAYWNATTNRWSRLPSAPVPTESEESVVFWTGRELIVWGLSTARGTVIGSGGVEFAPR